MHGASSPVRTPGQWYSGRLGEVNAMPHPTNKEKEKNQSYRLSKICTCILNFRRRRVDQSANCVPQTFLISLFVSFPRAPPGCFETLISVVATGRPSEPVSIGGVAWSSSPPLHRERHGC